jgi:hypothetical protein
MLLLMKSKERRTLDAETRARRRLERRLDDLNGEYVNIRYKKFLPDLPAIVAEIEAEMRDIRAELKRLDLAEETERRSARRAA